MTSNWSHCNKSTPGIQNSQLSLIWHLFTDIAMSNINIVAGLEKRKSQGFPFREGSCKDFSSQVYFFKFKDFPGFWWHMKE